MNYRNYVLERLSTYEEQNIVITSHARYKAMLRGIHLREIRENILNPKRLMFAGKQQAKNKSEEKFDCYFVYSGQVCHRYVLVFTSSCIVCTVIKIHRRWKKLVEKYGEIQLQLRYRA